MARQSQHSATLLRRRARDGSQREISWTGWCWMENQVLFEFVKHFFLLKNHRYWEDLRLSLDGKAGPDWVNKTFFPVFSCWRTTGTEKISDSPWMENQVLFEFIKHFSCFFLLKDPRHWEDLWPNQALLELCKLFVCFLLYLGSENSFAFCLSSSSRLLKCLSDKHGRRKFQAKQEPVFIAFSPFSFPARFLFMEGFRKRHHTA